MAINMLPAPSRNRLNNFPNVELYLSEKGFGIAIESTTGIDIWGVVRVLEDKYGWIEEKIFAVFSARISCAFTRLTGKEIYRIGPKLSTSLAFGFEYALALGKKK